MRSSNVSELMEKRFRCQHRNQPKAFAPTPQPDAGGYPVISRWDQRKPGWAELRWTADALGCLQHRRVQV